MREMDVKVLIAVTKPLPLNLLPADSLKRWEFALPVFEEQIFNAQETFNMGEHSLVLRVENFLEAIRAARESTHYLGGVDELIEGIEVSPYWKIIYPFDPHAVFIGQTIMAEGIVRFIRKVSQISPIIFRCSYLYPKKPNFFTGVKPQDAGYNFDVPKSLEAIDLLVFNPNFLEAIGSRDIGKVKKVIGELNKYPFFMSNPIIIFGRRLFWLSIKKWWQKLILGRSLSDIKSLANKEKL